MSDHTPTYEDMEIEYGLDKHFRWWLQARESRIEAAAEQRGAEKALQDFKTFVLRVLPKGLVNRAAILADLDESMKRLDETGHLLMGPLRRANHMEGDDVES